MLCNCDVSHEITFWGSVCTCNCQPDIVNALKRSTKLHSALVPVIASYGLLYVSSLLLHRISSLVTVLSVTQWLSIVVPRSRKHDIHVSLCLLKAAFCLMLFRCKPQEYWAKKRCRKWRNKRPSFFFFLRLSVSRPSLWLALINDPTCQQWKPSSQLTPRYRCAIVKPLHYGRVGEWERETERQGGFFFLLLFF